MKLQGFFCQKLHFPCLIFPEYCKASQYFCQIEHLSLIRIGLRNRLVIVYSISRSAFQKAPMPFRADWHQFPQTKRGYAYFLSL